MSGNSLAAHESVTALSAHLTVRGVRHEVVEHPAAFTAAGEARAAGVAPDQMAKTVVLEDHGTYLLAIVPASERISLRKVRGVLGATKSLRLATEKELGSAFAQFELGSVPPVGESVFAGEVVDSRIAELDSVLCAGGDHRHALRVAPDDMIRLSDAKVADICED